MKMPLALKIVLGVFLALTAMLLLLIIRHLVYGYQCDVKEHLVELHENELAVIETYTTKRKSKLSFLRKNGQTWEIADSFHLKINRIPAKVVFNDRWLAISSAPEFFAYFGKRSGEVFLYRREGNQWIYSKRILPGVRGLYLANSAMAFTDDDILICGNYTTDDSQGKVYCYDVNSSPPAVVQIIEPPPSVAHEKYSSSFGTEIHFSGDVMLIKDGSAIFSDEEKSRYGLNERNPTARDKNQTPRTITTVLVYARKNGKWEYEENLYHLLPHPRGGVLRNEYGYIDTFMTDSIIFHMKNTTLVHDKIFLRTSKAYYLFEKNRSDKWECVRKLSPPFKLEDRVIEGNVMRIPYEKITIGEQYTGRLLEDGSFDIYETDRLLSWRSKWNCHFIPEDLKKEFYRVTQKNKLPTIRDLYIKNNVIVATHNPIYAYREKDPYHTKYFAGIVVFEINPNTGSEKVFELQSKKDIWLEPTWCGRKN